MYKIERSCQYLQTQHKECLQKNMFKSSKQGQLSRKNRLQYESSGLHLCSFVSIIYCYRKSATNLGQLETIYLVYKLEISRSFLAFPLLKTTPTRTEHHTWSCFFNTQQQKKSLVREKTANDSLQYLKLLKYLLVLFIFFYSLKRFLVKVIVYSAKPKKIKKIESKSIE